MSSARFWLLHAEDAAEGWTPLMFAGDPAQPTLAWLPRGEGGVLAMSDAVEVANGVIDLSSTALVATRALSDRMAPGDTVYFSEFHQGLDGRRGVFRESFAIASGSAAGRVGIHLAAAALLLLVVTGRPFGSPLPPGEPERRSTLEHVNALARIYQASSAERTVAKRLVRGAARRVGATHPPGDDPEVEILRRWAERTELEPFATAALRALATEPPDLEALERSLDGITAGMQTTSRTGHD